MRRSIMNFNSELLNKLVKVYGPSSNETRVRELITNEIKEYVDDIRVDIMGNLIAHKKGYDICSYGSNRYDGN